MSYTEIINGLSFNKNVFKEIFSGLTEEMYLWKPASDKWCMLEIICHLFDEEREDFRTRVFQVLEDPTEKLPPIDPQGWVKERNYIQENFNDKLIDFLLERERSVSMLKGLSNPNWDNPYVHPKFGKMKAGMFLINWLAHDHLHIRQITKLKYDYLKYLTNEDLDYAGNW